MKILSNIFFIKKIKNMFNNDYRNVSNIFLKNIKKTFINFFHCVAR